MYKRIYHFGKRVTVFSLIFTLVFIWVFSGWPSIYINNTLQFPPAPQETNAAITLGTTGTAVNFNGSNPTISITPVAGDDVCIFQAFDRNATAPSGITETTGSDTWTAASNSGTTDVWIGQWYLNNPTAEAKTIQLTISSGIGWMNVLCMQGTDTTTPVNDSRSVGTTASSGEPSQAITTDNANSWIITVCGNFFSNSATYGTNQTEVWAGQQGGGTKHAAAGTRELLATSGTDTQSCTFSKSIANGIHSIEVVEAAAGTLTIDIVDSGGTPVASPSMVMTGATFSYSFQTATGTFGTASEKIRVNNGTGTATWTASIAASATTSFWDSTGTDYDFNDPTASAGDGGDADSLGGQMTVDASGSTITPEGGCSTTGIIKGSSAAFSEGVTNSITIMSAGATADTSCYWDQTSISISQSVPAEQPAASDYNIDMVVSVVASQLSKNLQCKIQL